MLNAVGLENPGLETVLQDIVPMWSRKSPAVVVSVVGESMEDFVELGRLADGVDGVAAVELNLSCPNYHNGAQFSQSPQLAALAVDAFRFAYDMPLLVKLSPNVPDIAPIAQAAEQAGADALTICNTLPAMALDAKTGRPVLANGSGGLSGKALHGVALHLIYRAFPAVGIPIIGAGGVASCRGALDFIRAGATAVQIGTAALRDPWQPLVVLAKMRDRLSLDLPSDSWQGLVGAAHR